MATHQGHLTLKSTMRKRTTRYEPPKIDAKLPHFPYAGKDVQIVAMNSLPHLKFMTHRLELFLCTLMLKMPRILAGTDFDHIIHRHRPIEFKPHMVEGSLTPRLTKLVSKWTFIECSFLTSFSHRSITGFILPTCPAQNMKIPNGAVDKLKPGALSKALCFRISPSIHCQFFFMRKYTIKCTFIVEQPTSLNLLTASANYALRIFYRAQ
jgi:hypothetical protein